MESNHYDSSTFIQQNLQDINQAAADLATVEEGEGAHGGAAASGRVLPLVRVRVRVIRKYS